MSPQHNSVQDTAASSAGTGATLRPTIRGAKSQSQHLFAKEIGTAKKYLEDELSQYWGLESSEYPTGNIAVASAAKKMLTTFGIVTEDWKKEDFIAAAEGLPAVLWSTSSLDKLDPPESHSAEDLKNRLADLGLESANRSTTYTVAQKCREALARTGTTLPGEFSALRAFDGSLYSRNDEQTAALREETTRRFVEGGDKVRRRVATSSSKPR